MVMVVKEDGGTFAILSHFLYAKNMEAALGKLAHALKQTKHSATRARRAVFAELLHSGPLSVSALAGRLEDAVDRATVYRTVELFESLGIVNRIWHGFKNQVELSEIFTPHHHHAVCQSCGATIDLASTELEAALGRLARQHGFIALNHSVELSGYCAKCQ